MKRQRLYFLHAFNKKPGTRPFGVILMKNLKPLTMYNSDFGCEYQALFEKFSANLGKLILDVQIINCQYTNSNVVM